MNQRQLEQECRSYARYLIGRTADDYVVRKYLAYHEQNRTAITPSDPFDRFLINLSARGPWWACLADVYASRFHRYSALRKKLVLTLAVLECSRDSFWYVDAAGAEGLLRVLGRLSWSASVYLYTLAVAILLLAPVQAWIALFDRSGKIPALARWTQS